MENTIIQYLIQQGSGYALAALIFWFYRKDVMKKIDEIKVDKDILITVISENKAALEKLTVLIEKIE